jgi:hypothetical protein
MAMKMGIELSALAALPVESMKDHLDASQSAAVMLHVLITHPRLKTTMAVN